MTDSIKQIRIDIGIAVAEMNAALFELKILHPDIEFDVFIKSEITSDCKVKEWVEINAKITE